MLLPGISVTFQERPQNVGPYPSCFPIIAAISAHGWCMPDDGYPTHDDVLTGMKHVDEFRGAHPSKLQRFITLRYLQKAVEIEGETFRVEQFVERCCSDPVFYRAVLRHPKYDRALEAVLASVPLLARQLAPTEHLHHGRLFLVPIGNTDTELMATMDRHFQSSWS